MVKIIDSRNNKGRLYDELDIGDCFMYQDCLYMVTADTILRTDVCEDYELEDVMNALQLNTGFLTRIDTNTLVEPVDVTLTIS